MSGEPGVEAVEMEGVAAAGEKTEGIGGEEGGETYRAVEEGGLRARASERGESEGWKSIDEGWREPGVPARGGVGGR